MIRIRTGVSWLDDPRTTSALRRAGRTERAAFARELADALAIEVDGVDLAFGLAEAPLLSSLEELLRAIAAVVSGAPQTAVVLGEGGLELVIRRRGESALLTVVALGHPSRVLARDVEVEVQALAKAALEAAAGFCRDLAEIIPEAKRDTRTLHQAVLRLSKAETRAPSGLPAGPNVTRTSPSAGRLGCAIEIADHEGLLSSYQGGRPDLGLLLVPGSVVLMASDGSSLCSLYGHPFLALRDLTVAADRALCAARRGDASVKVPLARPGHKVATLELSLLRGETSLDGRRIACAPLALLRAFVEAALEFSRLARAFNPLQAENAHLVELEASAVERIAELDELSGGDLLAGPAFAVRGPSQLRPLGRPLGPGRLRRLSYRRFYRAELGAPAGLFSGGGRLLAAGQRSFICLDLLNGKERFRALGAPLVAAFPGAVLLARPDGLRLLSPSSGRLRWEKPLPGAAPSGAALLRGGPIVLAEPGAVTGLDLSTGAHSWRFSAPGASRTLVTGFGSLVVAGSDTGFLHGLDAEGRLVWRVRAPGPLLFGPTAWGGSCLALCETATGSALLSLDAATGVRRFEAPLELTPCGPPAPWGGRLAIPGTVAGDPVVTVLQRDGAPSWTAAPPLSGAPAVLPSGSLLVVRGALGGLTALERDGRPRWTRPGGPSSGRAGGLSLSRETVVAAGEGVSCHALETGELVGALPSVSAKLLLVDRELTIAALDVDGFLTVHRLATHLSLV